MDELQHGFGRGLSRITRRMIKAAAVGLVVMAAGALGMAVPALITAGAPVTAVAVLAAALVVVLAAVLS